MSGFHYSHGTHMVISQCHHRQKVFNKVVLRSCLMNWASSKEGAEGGVQSRERTDTSQIDSKQEERQADGEGVH